MSRFAVPVAAETPTPCGVPMAVEVDGRRRFRRCGHTGARYIRPATGRGRGYWLCAAHDPARLATAPLPRGEWVPEGWNRLA